MDTEKLKCPNYKCRFCKREHCAITIRTDCYRCPFATTKQEHVERLEKSLRRLSELSKEKQKHIREKYYKKRTAKSDDGD